MNKQLKKLGLALILLYVLLFVQLNIVQVVRANDYNNDPANNRETVRDFTRQRGAITTADGAVLARSVASDDKYKFLREYPEGDLFGQVTGYFSFKYGTAGVEKQYNDVLAGQTAQQRLAQFGNLFDDSQNTGDVILTLRKDVQQVARDALGDKEGSVTVLDPRDGSILAMWSNPSFDPNTLATHDFAAADAARASLLASPSNPLLVKNYQERYMPGSTFKVITTTAALESGAATLATTFPRENEFTPPLTTNPIQNYSRTNCGGDLPEVFRRSCNTSFARLGLMVGPVNMVKTAEAFGFNHPLPIDMPRPAASFFPSVQDFVRNDPKLAMVSFGQNDVQGTPLNMALLAATVANNGVMMTPHVMAETRDAKGNVIDKYQPKPLNQVMQPETASTLRDLMITVVQNGTAKCCMQLDNGVQAAAKTGTAQLGTNPPLSHAWIIAFAPAEAPTVAISVFVKATPEVTEGTGGTVAGPIARQVLNFVLANVSS
jgi:penicillin-binding protein A